MNSELTDIKDKRDVNQYCSICSFDGEGTIYDGDAEAVWKYEWNSRNRFPFASLHVAPAFTLRDKACKEQVTMVCTRRYPVARFNIFKNSQLIGSISKNGIFLNKYSAVLYNKEKFDFEMPLFSTIYGGLFNDGTKVKVRVFRKDTWYFNIPMRVDSLELVSILAFFHQQRLWC